jgi:hypothetical protein
MTKTSPPSGLSRQARQTWRELTVLHRFERHELEAFNRALLWWDRSDRAWTASETATGGDHTRLVKQAIDAANAALRHWRTLKFIDPAAVRRPGRPSDSEWSAKRKAQLQKVV